MAAIRSRISTLLVIFMVAVLAATVGYSLAQSSAPAKVWNGGSATIDLLHKNGKVPKACYKHSGKAETKNKHCQPGGHDSGGGGGATSDLEEVEAE